MIRCKVQLQRGKSPLAAVTCESTQPTLNTTAQYGTFVLESFKFRRIQSQERLHDVHVTEGQITLSRAFCNIVAYLERVVIVLFRIMWFSLFCLTVLLCSFCHIKLRKRLSPSQLVTMRFNFVFTWDFLLKSGILSESI